VRLCASPTLLKVKSLNLGSLGSPVRPFLAKALEPPPAQSVNNALDLLEAIGAVHVGTEALTALGKHLAKLPMDPRLGKMLVVACCVRCLGPALTIAAALAHRSPFVMPIEGKERADAAKEYFADDSCSDHLAVLSAFNQWQELRRRCRSAAEEERWCWDHFVSLPALRTMQDLRAQFAGLLRDAGFVPTAKAPEDGRPSGEERARRADGLLGDRRGRDGGGGEGGSGGGGGGGGIELPDAVDGLRDETCLVRAVVCAGLFPRVAAVSSGGRRGGNKGKGKGGKGRIRMLWHTREDGKVDPHPGSVNAFPLGAFEYSWMVYGEKVRSPGGTMVRDSTNVSDLALLLFGGELCDDAAGTADDCYAKVSMLNGYVTFAAPRSTIELVKRLRRAMDAHLDARIQDPRAHSTVLHGSVPAGGLAAEHGPLTDAVLTLLRSEDGYAKMQPAFGGSFGPPRGKGKGQACGRGL